MSVTPETMAYTRYPNSSVMFEPPLDTDNVTLNISEYDYDIDNYNAPLEELIPVSFAYGATLLLGIIGNGLVIFSVSRYAQMRTITNTFLLSLAIADLLLVICCIPVKFAAFFSYTWRFGEFSCKAIHYVQNISTICSVTTLTFMSMERYYAIVHPMKARYACTKGRARRILIALWVTSILLATPILIGRVHLTVVGKKRTAMWCVKYFYDPVVRKMYEIYMFCLILLFPVLIMTFAYFRICQELWFMSRHRHTMMGAADSSTSQYYGTNNRPNIGTPPANSEDDSTKMVIKMLVAVVIVFILCWGPILINNLLVAFGWLPELNIPPFKYMREAFHLMSYANSCVNPIVYGFMSRNFRQSFKQALCSCLKGRQYLRKLTFKKQSCVIQENWNCNTGTRHSVLASTTTRMDSRTGDMYEMVVVHDSSDDASKV